MLAVRTHRQSIRTWPSQPYRTRARAISVGKVLVKPRMTNSHVRERMTAGISPARRMVPRAPVRDRRLPAVAALWWRRQASSNHTSACVRRVRYTTTTPVGHSTRRRTRAAAPGQAGEISVARSGRSGTKSRNRSQISSIGAKPDLYGKARLAPRAEAYRALACASPALRGAAQSAQCAVGVWCSQAVWLHAALEWVDAGSVVDGLDGTVWWSGRGAAETPPRESANRFGLSLEEVPQGRRSNHRSGSWPWRLHTYRSARSATGMDRAKPRLEYAMERSLVDVGCRAR